MIRRMIEDTRMLLWLLILAIGALVSAVRFDLSTSGEAHRERPAPSMGRDR